VCVYASIPEPLGDDAKLLSWARRKRWRRTPVARAGAADGDKVAGSAELYGVGVVVVKMFGAGQKVSRGEPARGRWEGECGWCGSECGCVCVGWSVLAARVRVQHVCVGLWCAPTWPAVVVAVAVDRALCRGSGCLRVGKQVGDCGGCGCAWVDAWRPRRVRWKVACARRRADVARAGVLAVAVARARRLAGW
jgi:hypothetical protein